MVTGVVSLSFFDLIDESPPFPTPNLPYALSHVCPASLHTYLSRRVSYWIIALRCQQIKSTRGSLISPPPPHHHHTPAALLLLDKSPAGNQDCHIHIARQQQRGQGTGGCHLLADRHI